jgi:hypothetical protein
MTIQFRTKVTKAGIISIPKRYRLAETEVEITLKQTDLLPEKRISAEEFISKWKGFLKGYENYKNDRIDYLIEKYK